MDDVRAEMAIYTMADIERGWSLLAAAEALARDPNVKRRIAFLQSSFAFTRTAARAHTVSMDAVTCRPPGSPEEAEWMSNAVVAAWRAFADQLARSEKIGGTSASGWHSKTFRVRAWALKQQMRDGVLAPLVRWACAREGEIDPQALRAAEKRLTRVTTDNRKAIEDLVTETVGAVFKPPRASPLRVADIRRVECPPTLGAQPANWPDGEPIAACPWVFRQKPRDLKIGKYDEPMPQCIVAPPDTTDQSITWQAAWDRSKLYLHVVVTDDTHVVRHSPKGLSKGDSVHITFNPNRDHFEYEEHSWYFLMGDYRKKKPGFVVALRDGKAAVEIVTPPASTTAAEAKDLIQTAVTHHGTRTVYDLAVDWTWLPGWTPHVEKSFGISLFVTDCDGDGPLRTAEYGDGMFPRRRPSEFAALRLVDRSP